MTYPVLSISQQNVSRIHCQYRVLCRPVGRRGVSPSGCWQSATRGAVWVLVEWGQIWWQVLRKFYELPSFIKTNEFCRMPKEDRTRRLCSWGPISLELVMQCNVRNGLLLSRPTRQFIRPFFISVYFLFRPVHVFPLATHCAAEFLFNSVTWKCGEEVCSNSVW